MNIHHEKHLLLDPAIRDWVVIPMLIILVLVGMGRIYVSNLIKTVPVVTGNLWWCNDDDYNDDDW